MSKYLKYLALALFTFSALSVCSCSKGEEGKEGSASKIDHSSTQPAKVFPVVRSGKAQAKKAADFTWTENGKEVNFSDYTKGKYVFLNFWGTWCPPCRREIPDIALLAKEMQDKNLCVIGVALERTDNVNEAIRGVSEFWNSKQMGYPVVIGTTDLTVAYGGIEAVPTTFLIDNKGNIVNTIQGAMSKEAFMAEINKMMKN